MRYLIVGIVVLILAFCGYGALQYLEKGSNVLELAEVQYNLALKEVKGTKEVPRSLKPDGSLKTVGVYNWTSGFFGGNLWYLYELTGNKKWKDEAIYWTEAMDTIQYWTGNHDVGFMINCSYGNAYRLTSSIAYKQVLINAAESLSTRFKPQTGCLKSWNYRKAWDGKTEWYFPVIIDNMMNLELLFNASKLSGNPKYRKIAITHALATMKNHYRDDYSCYHVVDYDSTNGAVLDKATCQGYTDESSWARGQAWGLYGYVMSYKETGMEEFLDFAENIASYIMKSELIPADKIPYWDYHVNQDGHVPEWDYKSEQFNEIPRDVSAATIVASALLDLSKMVIDGEKYYDYASSILESVESNPAYIASEDERNYFILKQSVGSVPHGGEVSKPVNYGDYYYFEALLRKRNIDGE